MKRLIVTTEDEKPITNTRWVTEQQDLTASLTPSFPRFANSCNFHYPS